MILQKSYKTAGLLRYVFAVLVATLFLAARVDARDQITISFDKPGTSIDDRIVHKRAQEGVGPRVLIGTEGQALSTAVTPAPSRIWISRDHQSGCCSLGMSITEETAENQPSKIEVNVARGDASDPAMILKNGHTHLLSFYFKQNDEYQNPVRWVLHLQVWQRSPLQPPLAMVAVPKVGEGTQATEYMLITRTDENIDRSMTWDNGKKLSLLNGASYFSLVKGRWHKFTFVLRPCPANRCGPETGLVAMWLDGKKLLDYRGSWSYSNVKGENTGFFVKLGIYRASQQRVQSVLFDDVIWGPWKGPVGEAEPELRE